MSRVLVLLLKLMESSDGKDKVLKLIQYSVKVWLWLYMKNQKHPAPLVSLTKQFSLTRKIIRLGHWLEGIEALKTQKQSDLVQTAGISVGIANDLSDDVVCLSKIGLLTKEWSDRYTPISDRLWFISILYDLHEASKQNPEDDRKRFILRVSIAKLLCDLVFCSFDVFEISAVSDGWQSLAGFGAASLSTLKLVLKLK